VSPDKQNDGHVDYHQKQDPQPRTGEEGQLGDRLGDTDRKGVGDGSGKPERKGQQAHSEARQRVPSQHVAEGHDEDDQRYHRFENTQNRSHDHEEELHQRHQQKSAASHPRRHDPEECTENVTPLEHGKRSSDEDQKENDGDHRDVPRRRQNFHRGGKPAPDRVVRCGYEGERARDDLHSSVEKDSIIATGGNDEGQNTRYDHQTKDYREGEKERPFADLDHTRTAVSSVVAHSPIPPEFSIRWR